MTNRKSEQSRRLYVHTESLENRTLLSGGLDPTFGTGGYVVGLPNETYSPGVYEAVAVQSNRDVIAAGIATKGGNTVLELDRYTASGAVDKSFGSAGSVQTSFGALDALSVVLLIQPNGQIIAGGTLSSSPASAPTAMAVGRYNSNGSLDKTFGKAGIVLFQGDQNPWLMWQKGELLVGSNNTVRRLTASGALDPAFPRNLPGGAVFAVQPDGKILVDDVVDFSGPPFSGMPIGSTLSRYNANGTLDTTFGAKGQAAGISDVPIQIAVESNGTIVELNGPNGYGIHEGGNFELDALNSNGSADNSFGENGDVLVKVGEQSFFQGVAVSLLQQPTGQLLVTQTTDFIPGTTAQGAKITRYSASGIVDTTFGDDGSQTVISTVPPLNSDSPYAFSTGATAALDKAGRLILAGGSLNQYANLVAIDTNNNTGVITGYMFYDFNGNGKKDPGDHALNWTCYIDLDNDGHYDNADILVYTNKAGDFTIPNLAPGVYHIRQSQAAHWQKTTPAEYTVTVTAGETVSGVIFASRYVG